jgi:hypothetical protein
MRLTPILAILPSLAGAQPPFWPDLVLRNGRIVTLDDSRPMAEAIAIRGECIAAVGTNEEASQWAGPETKVVDLRGKTVIPGINETHIHVRDLGFQQHYAVNLEEARNISDVKRLLRERLEELRREGRLGGWAYPTTGETGEWLFGLGWTQDRLEENRMANRHELDSVSRDVPVSLERIYRGIAVNTRVFELMGIDFEDPSTHPEWFRRTPRDVEAGDVIFRDPDTGLPNGVFVGERAPRLVAAAIPEKSLEQKVESLALGLEILASYGITAIVEPGNQLGRVTVRISASDFWTR